MARDPKWAPWAFLVYVICGAIVLTQWINTVVLWLLLAAGAGAFIFWMVDKSSKEREPFRRETRDHAIELMRMRGETPNPPETIQDAIALVEQGKKIKPKR